MGAHARGQPSEMVGGWGGLEDGGVGAEAEDICGLDLVERGEELPGDVGLVAGQAIEKIGRGEGTEGLMLARVIGGGGERGGLADVALDELAATSPRFRGRG